MDSCANEPISMGWVANMLACDIAVSGFELQVRYYVV